MRLLPSTLLLAGHTPRRPRRPAAPARSPNATRPAATATPDRDAAGDRDALGQPDTRGNAHARRHTQSPRPPPTPTPSPTPTPTATPTPSPTPTATPSPTPTPTPTPDPRLVRCAGLEERGAILQGAVEEVDGRVHGRMGAGPDRPRLRRGDPRQSGSQPVPGLGRQDRDRHHRAARRAGRPAGVRGRGPGGHRGHPVELRPAPSMRTPTGSTSRASGSRSCAATR